MKLDHNGMSLIESLFAFMIYINIIVLLLSSFFMVLKSNNRIEKNNSKSKEVIISDIETIEDVLITVLP